MKQLLFILLIAIGFGQYLGQKTKTIAFYNVENLFDTIDGPNDDTEYLPTSKIQWNSAKYLEKLSHIREVLLAMGKPIICGFSEVENANVVRAIIDEQKAFKNYGVVHYESPDARGIDVAMIYDSCKLKLLASNHIRFLLPDEIKATTRDIIWAQFSYKKQIFYVMVNHWPSRRGGAEASDEKRVTAARAACSFIDSVQKTNRYPIIFMGDLNDHPNNNAPKLISERLEPMISSLSGPTQGTHYYNKEWGILDHIYISANLLDLKSGVVSNSGKIYNFPFLMEEFKGNIQPKRTFVGEKYIGGYSDHLPVSIEVRIK